MAFLSESSSAETVLRAFRADLRASPSALLADALSAATFSARALRGCQVIHLLVPFCLIAHAIEVTAHTS
eukprot:4019822-Pleurochrysis_carterae.AAC.1